jgi:hypothetical protein
MYEIRVAGVVPEEDLQDMGAVTAAPDQVSTILYGVPNQAALYCLLARLRALGVEAIGIRRGSASLVELGGGADKETDTDAVPLRTCYEVALTGRFGPVFTAVVSALGAKRIVTTSIFRLPASRHTGVRDIAAMLEARGLMILNIDGRPPRSAISNEGGFTRSG